MASRAAAVVRIRINPHKYVGYLDEGTNFLALGADVLGRTVHGVKFTWESSTPDKLQIDETGSARFLQSGLAWVTCRAGSAAATAPVFIKPNHRPRQSDAQWRADQESLGEDGILRGDLQFPTDEKRSPGLGGMLSSLIDKLAPTAFAQGGGCMECPGGWHSDDLGYDELWSEPRNRLGSPRDGVVEPMPLGTVLPEGSNFKWALPLETLGGRGLATNLTLYYNSRVWSRRDSRVAFDAISGWPAPGFSLGYGRMVVYDIGAGSNPPCKFMLVQGDGTSHYLGAGTWNGIGYQTGVPIETSDGTHIVYTGNARDGGDLRYSDGTKVTYNPVNNRLVPTRITERNGNYVQISYKVDEAGTFPPMALESIVDTLGRSVGFEYDSAGHLTSVGGGTSFVKFDYQNVTSSYNFSGLTVERQPTTSLRLRHIYFPATGTGYLPSYSQYGMIYSVSARRQMTTSGGWPPGTPVVITDGVESANVSFNYPTSGSTQLTDAPAFNQRTETGVNSPTAVYGYSSSTDTVAQTMTFSITRPDSTTIHLTRSTNTSSPANGRMVQSELKLGTASFAKSVLSYANDGGGSPQVQSVIVYDDASPANQTKVDFDRDNYGNVTNKREYGFQVGGAWQVRRRTHYTYKTDAAYINAYLRRLPRLVEVFDPITNPNDPIAKTSYTYDDYQAMGGLENYGGTASPPGHVSYWVQLGNVTGVTQWTDVVAGTTIVHLAKYDIFGNVVKAQQFSCCQEAVLTTTEATYWAVIEVETRGAPGTQQTESIDYDFSTLLPVSTTDAGGLTTTYGYDFAHNLTSIVLPTGANALAGYDYGNMSSTKTVRYLDWGGTGTLEETMTKTLITTTHYDGWGRVRDTINPAGAQVNTSYDAIGRVAARTNPFPAGGTPGPATTLQYDALGRATITTLPDTNTVQNTYSGATVTAIDQVNRKIKREVDGLGRLIKVTEQDGTGALTQETSYTYNLLDKLTGVNQGGQLRGYKYDAIGRLLFEKIPEQTPTIADGGVPNQWTTAYAYTEFNSVKKKTDARGVESHYLFDALHRVTQTWYTGVGGNDAGTVRPSLPGGVAATGDVTLAYSGSGAVSSVSIGSNYSESYTFDGYNRPASMTRTIDTKSYTTSYEYNGGSQLTKLTYASARVVGLGYDDFGRLKGLPYDSHVPAGAGYLTGMTYNTAGQVSGLTLGNGVSESFGYDPNRLQLITYNATAPGGGFGGLMQLSYVYQASAGQSGAGTTAGNAGQLTALFGTIAGIPEGASYSYDVVGRLVTSYTGTNNQSANRRYAYDRWGNRTGMWDALSAGNQIQLVTLEQSGGAPTNRVTSVTNSGVTSNYLYDVAGNLINDGLHSYQYDAENRLASVDGGVTASYKYDHQNRRASKIVGSSVTHYAWEGSRVIAEHNGSTGAVLIDYVYLGRRMIAKISGGTTQYFLSDRLSARVLLDASGNVIGRQAHLPFGEDFGESGSQEKHHFTSYDRDGESASDYAVNRQYAPSIGRFMRVDPKTGPQDKPQSFNRYAYAWSDPMNLTDPLGLNVAYGDGVCYIVHVWGHYGPADDPTPFDSYTIYCFSGGGGGEPMDPNPGTGSGYDDPSTVEWQLKRIREAIDLAFLKLIDSLDCQAFLGTRGWPAMQTLERLQRENRIQRGNTFGNIAEYWCGPGCIVGRNPGVITLDAINFFGKAMEKEAALRGITLMEAYALTILHELGHATGALPYDGPFSGDQSDRNQDAVFNHCFK